AGELVLDPLAAYIDASGDLAGKHERETDAHRVVQAADHLTADRFRFLPDARCGLDRLLGQLRLPVSPEHVLEGRKFDRFHMLVQCSRSAIANRPYSQGLTTACAVAITSSAV